MRRMALLVAIVVAAAGSAALLARAPGALARVAVFEVREVRLEGATFLPLDEAVAAAGIDEGASVWDDLDTWSAALREHPLVDEVRIRRRLPATLVLEIVERAPVALLPTPMLEPVDRSGAVLPVDPSRQPMDLPLIRPWTWEATGRALSPHEIRFLAEEAGRLAESDPSFLATLSEIAWEPGGGIVALGGRNRVLLRFHAPLSTARIREAVAVLSDAAGRLPDASGVVVDLRFEEQVVVRPLSGPAARSLSADS